MQSSESVSVPPPGLVTTDESGVSFWRPAITRLQVCRVKCGDVVVQVSGVVGGSAEFSLSPDQARHLALQLCPKLGA